MLNRLIGMAIAAATGVSQGLNAQENIHLAEVVVTAQKQAQTVQDVPLTVNMVSGEAFRDTANFDFADIGQMTAGIELRGSGNTQNITMRGIGTDLQGASQARVTTYLDGSYIANQQLLFTSQFDIQRYEVLRGPQGTLYGKASPTGAIVIYTKDPNLQEVEGNVSASAGQYSLRNTELGLSLPLVEGELAVRLSGIYHEDASHDVSNRFHGESMSRTSGGRMTLLWEPGNDFSLRLSHTHVENTPPGISQVAGNGIDAEDRRSIIDLKRESNIRVDTTILGLEWDMGWASLISQSLYAESTNTSIEDTDATDVSEQSEAVALNFVPIFNQELRLESLGNERWDWMLGAYYQRTRMDADVISKDHNQLLDLGLGYWIPGSDATALTLKAANEDFGLYSHNTVFVADGWTVTLGARWTKERFSNLTEAVYYLDIPDFSLSESFPLPDFASDDTFHAWSGTAKLQYDFMVDQMAYLTLDSGGKSGGQSLDLVGNIPSDKKTFEDESSTSVELGYKARFMDGRMSVNAALYRTAYKDFQLNAVDIEFVEAGEIEQVTFVDNADEVVSRGAEVELQYQLNLDWFAGISIAYNDTRFEDYKDAPCNTGAPGPLIITCDRSGQRLGGDSSEWSTVLNTEYSQPLAGLGVDWYISGLYNFNSSRVTITDREKLGGFGTVDIFAGIRNQHDGWDLKLWVKNLTDKQAFTGLGARRALTDMSLAYTSTAQALVTSYDTGYRSVSYTKPRQVGVSVSYSF